MRDDIQENTMSIAVSLLGCCAIRDIFGLHYNDGGYSVRRFVQDVSPISMVTKTPLLRELTDDDDYLFDGKNRFWGKCQKIELQKNTFEYLADEPFEYLIFDVAEFRRKLLHFGYNDSYFSENYYLNDFLKRYIDSGVIPDKYDIINPLNMDTDLREKLLIKFCEAIKKLCPSERIILVEIQAGKPYTSVENDPLIGAEIETAIIFNDRMSYAFSFVKSNMPGIHVIEFPNNVKIDPHHKWGRNLLHYEMRYYDYALEAIDLITREHIEDLELEKQLLRELRARYEETI
jgi:hypothetical protein